MKQHYTFLAACTLLAGSLFAQVVPCYTDEAMKDLFAKDPEAKARYEKSFNEPAPAGFASRGGQQQTSALSFPLDTVPIVFHILHEGGSENVSNAVIYQALAEVNKIMLKQNSDTTSIDPYFQPVAGRSNVYFKLATTDPNGNCTNGIVRHYDANTNWSQSAPGYAYSGSTAGKWNPTKYLNIYVVKTICQTQPCSQSGGIIVGYTYLPGTWSAGSAADAIVYNFQFLTGSDARSLAHEIGHWLGLPHTFGSTNSPGTCTSSSDDYLASGTAGSGVTDDTPKTPGAYSNCPASTPNSCDASNYHNVQNVMDYSSCPINFTDGQCQRMRNVLNLSTAGRNNLCTSANKIATGVRYPAICVPVANFRATARTVCPNTIITFSDSSENAQVTSWNWDFPGGTLQSGSTLTDSMPKVVYASPGTYAVSYTAATSAGSNSISKTNYINVLTNVASYNSTWAEGFETSTVPGTDWETHSSPTFDWSVTTNAAASGTSSTWLDNLTNTPGTISILESTSFDISSFATPRLTLKLAYRQQTSSDYDKFQVLTSTDCGASWTARFTRQGSTLATVTPPSTFPFVPGPANFATYTVNINGVAGSNNVRFRFLFHADVTGTGAVGNNIYLDDINLFDASIGIDNIEDEIGLNVFPNPSSGQLNVEFSLLEARSISVEVTDVLGRAVESVAGKQYGSGTTTLNLAQKQHYAPGVYFVNLGLDDKKIIKKVLVQ